MAAQLCASSKVKMDIIGNNTISKALKDAVTYYVRASDAVCATRLMSVYNVMHTNLLLITPDYLTAAQLATFLTKITSFRTMKGSTTLVNTNMPVLTAQLKTDLKQTSADILVLKMLLKKYKTTNLVFFNGLMAACKMPAVTILHTPVYITVIDESSTSIPPAVLSDVQGTLTKSKQLPVTNIAGIMVYYNVQGGKTTGTFAKPGFITKIVEMPIVSGKTNTFTVALTPGIMTAEQEEAVKATIAKVIADEKAATASKKKIRKDAKATAALVTVIIPEVIVPKTTENGAI